jgi:hypothetical protein
VSKPLALLNVVAGAIVGGLVVSDPDTLLAAVVWFVGCACMGIWVYWKGGD